MLLLHLFVLNAMQKTRGHPKELRLTSHSFPSMASDFFIYCTSYHELHCMESLVESLN